MHYRINYAESFLWDYGEAVDYIGRTLQNPIAARKMDDKFEKAKSTVLGYPKATKPFAVPPQVDTPYYTIPVGNYLALYVVLDDVIEFRRFLYAHSDLSHRLEP